MTYLVNYKGVSHMNGSLLSWHLKETTETVGTQNHKKLPVWHTWQIVSLSLCLVSKAVSYKSGDSLQSGYNFCSAEVILTPSQRIVVTFTPILQF